MGGEPDLQLDYSTRAVPWYRSRRVCRWLGWGTAATLFLATILTVLVNAVFPWIWYGSEKAYWVHQHGSEQGYWEHMSLVYSAPPGLVVYEEEPAAAARLLNQVGLDGGDSAYLPTGETELGPTGWTNACAAYQPAPFAKRNGDYRSGGCAFMHERTAPSGQRRIVAVRCHSYRREGQTELHGVLRMACLAGPPGSGFGMTKFKAGYLEIPPHDGHWRLYAGQPDRKDRSHFTIGYAINGVRGTIDGWLQADDAVKLQIRDGPGTKPVGKRNGDACAGKNRIRG